MKLSKPEFTRQQAIKAQSKHEKKTAKCPPCDFVNCRLDGRNDYMCEGDFALAMSMVTALNMSAMRRKRYHGSEYPQRALSEE